MAQLKDTTINGDLIVNGNIEGYTIDELKNMINGQSANSNSAWIDLNKQSIFDYFPCNGETGIYSCYNATDLPSGMSEDSQFVVLKSHEMMFIFDYTDIYYTSCYEGAWENYWQGYTLNLSYTLSYPTDKFSTSQCLCQRSGNICHVYVSLKTSTAISAGTIMALTGHPETPILQNFGVLTPSGTLVNVQVYSENIDFKLSEDISSGTWLRFTFSYVCTY